MSYFPCGHASELADIRKEEKEKEGKQKKKKIEERKWKNISQLFFLVSADQKPSFI